jgi:hypothetical protein
MIWAKKIQYDVLYGVVILDYYQLYIALYWLVGAIIIANRYKESIV